MITPSNWEGSSQVDVVFGSAPDVGLLTIPMQIKTCSQLPFDAAFPWETKKIKTGKGVEVVQYIASLKLVSFWDGLFSGAMLVSGRVYPNTSGVSVYFRCVIGVLKHLTCLEVFG